MPEATQIDRAKKLELDQIWKSTKCHACDRSKSPQHWVCLHCRAKAVDTSAEKACRVACDAHLKAVFKLIASLKGR